MTPGFKQQTTNRAKILVVDDDREMCQFLADLLGEEGYLVETVHDGRRRWKNTERAALT